jgi:hypothetical protein
MNKTKNNTFEYIFSNTQYNGQYNYTIWVLDNAGNNNFSLNSFNVSYFFGNNKIGTENRTVKDSITGSYFTINEYALANNITAYVHGVNTSSPTYKCMIYRIDDLSLIGTTEEKNSSYTGWITLNFSNPKPKLIKNTKYVLTCWGNDNMSKIYFDRIYPLAYGRSENEPYGSPPNITNWTYYENKLYSLYCNYSPDNTASQITNINSSPYTIGFGYNVTITANVTDDLSGVDLVKAQISYPGGKSGNFTMTHTMGDTYQYLFTDTWLTGQYNYTIWVIDNSSNSNSSTGHHFYVSANASISIATLQDSYTGSQYINITDPPNPPENYTLIDRGLTWDEYYNSNTGQNILEVSAGPINYQQENGTWRSINTSINQLTGDHPAYVYGYRNGNDHGLYGVYFKSNAQQEWPVAFTYNKSDDPTIHAIRSKLVGVGYVDPQSDWAYEYLQNVQSSQGQTNEYSITYPGVFTGVDVTWSYGNVG